MDDYERQMRREDRAFRITIWTLAIAGILAIVLSMTTESDARPVCIPWTEMKQSLETTFHEQPIAGGVINGGNAMVQVYASDNGATFTVVVIGTNGIACGIAAGADWQQMEIPKGDPS